MEKGNNRLVFKRIDDETRYYDIINIFLEYYYFRINESSIFVKESVYNFITTNILHEMYICRWKSRGEIINRGWMELVFLDSQWSNLATCTTQRVYGCAWGEDEPDRWIAIKREDIDFHLNTSVLVWDVPPVDQTTNFTRPLMSGCAAD